MNMPVRIQRKRVKGFKLPPNTICITRGTKYGNPFKVCKIGKQWFVKCAADSRMQAHILVGVCHCGYGEKCSAVVDAIKCYELYIKEIKLDLSDLKTADYIACFCGLNEACHGDFLIKQLTKPINIVFIIVRNKTDYKPCIFCQASTIWRTKEGAIPCCPECSVNYNDGDLNLLIK